MSNKLRVLFVCVANDARSAMAEALLRHLESEHFEAHSAGTQATRLDSRTVSTLEHAGVSTAGLRSKSIDERDAERSRCLPIRIWGVDRLSSLKLLGNNT